MKYYHAVIWGQGAWTRKRATKEQEAKAEILLAGIAQNLEEDDEF